MTPRETLEKYGLKTDVKSIRERQERLADSTSDDNEYWDAREIYDADFSLLCELAEIGERTLEISKHTFDPNIKRAISGNDIILEELKGEPR